MHAYPSVDAVTTATRPCKDGAFIAAVVIVLRAKTCNALPSMSEPDLGDVMEGGLRLHNLLKMAARRLLDLLIVEESEDSAEADSADEDYTPSTKKVYKREEKIRPRSNRGKTTKRRHSTSMRLGHGSKSCCKKDKKATNTDLNIDKGSSFILSLPNEVISLIFSLISAQVGAIPFLNKISRVCRLWREVARSPLLWRTVVLQGDPVPSTDKALGWLATTHSSSVRHLHLIHCKTLSRRGVGLVQKHFASNLETFVIDSCRQVSGNDIAELANHMPCVRCFASRGPPLLVRQPSHLAAPLFKEGSPLAHMELNICTDMLQILHESATLQKPLVLLQLHSLTLTAEQLFNRCILHDFQGSCPNLKELELQFPTTERNFRYWTTPPESKVPGFPHLRALSVGCRVETCFGQLGDFQWEADFLCDLTAGSPTLESLYLGGLCYIPIPVLCNTVSSRLEHLSLSRMDFNETMPLILTHFYKLKSLALHIPQGEKSTCISDQVLVSVSQSSIADTLERISLSKSDISDKGLSMLLQHCPNLSYLNLETCRGLSRGLKQRFSGNEVEKLRQKVCVSAQTNSSVNS